MKTGSQMFKTEEKEEDKKVAQQRDRNIEEYLERFEKEYIKD